MHPLLRTAADRQLGLFTAVDARRAGYEHGEIRHLCSSGAWTRVRRGVYAVTEELATARSAGRGHAVDCTAVLLDLGRPEAAVSHTSALRLLGLPARRALLPDTVRLTHPDLWRRGRGFSVNAAPLPPGDVTTRGSLRLTTPARTLVDCAREWDLVDAVVALDAALHGSLVLRSDLTATVLRQSHWLGIGSAARAVELADGRAESPLETRGRLGLRDAGFHAFESQVEVHGPAGLVARVDGWLEDIGVALEFDGLVKYTDPYDGRTPAEVAWREKLREDAIRDLDIPVLRIVQADLPRLERPVRRLHELARRAQIGPRRFRVVRRPEPGAEPGDEAA